MLPSARNLAALIDEVAQHVHVVLVAMRRVAKIASHFNLKPIAVECLLNRPDFKEEVARQEAISEGRSADLAIADRVTRVSDLSRLLERIPARRTALKLKILGQIRQEVGDN